MVAVVDAFMRHGSERSGIRDDHWPRRNRFRLPLSAFRLPQSVPFVLGTPRHSRVGFPRHPHRPSSTLEDRLGDVVPVAAVMVPGRANCRARWPPSACQKSSTSSLSKSPILGEGKSALKDKCVAARQIDGNRRQRLFHRQREMPVAADARLVAQRLADGLAKANADVFDRVVLVDVQVTIRRDRQIDHPMLGKQLEHVVKKPHSGRDSGLAGPVEIDFERRSRFRPSFVEWLRCETWQEVRLSVKAEGRRK